VRAVIDINYLVDNKLLINKGSEAKISIGNTVINKDGVVGQISSVNSQNSQVMLITHRDFKIYLEDRRFKSKMLATGIENNNLLVKYIDKNSKIAVGDILVTTGLDDLYPGNLPVARIIKIFREENGFNSALCVPVVNFNQLQFVVVLRRK
jgi:rod shape-determining protein MreC